VQRARATELLLLAAFAWLSVDRNRYIVFFALAALYGLACLAGPLAPAGRRAWAAVLALCVAGAGLLFQYGNMAHAYPYSTPSPNFTPPRVEHIEEHRLRGNVVNSYELGAELIHRYYPRLRPSIDSRIDSYGEMYFVLHQDLWRNEAAMLEFIDRYDVRHMLLLHRDFAQVRSMNGLLARGWRVRFADQKMALLGRPAAPLSPAPAQ
jgi:hypothetical protein